ncbi:MAG: helix-turn-helix domain-containing protein [Anaerolineales bacterium]|nr:helix-turn-helix domain-containing protein [Anaerolineales bacterium]
MDIGSSLREAREARGVTLTQAAAVTRIRLPFLEALENNDFGALPGDMYVRGFIRNYAAYLNIDAEPLIAQLGSSDNVIRIPERRREREEGPLLISEPLTSSAVPFARIMATILAFAVVGLIAFAIWGPRDQILGWLPDFAGSTPPPTATLSDDLTMSDEDASPTVADTEAPESSPSSDAQAGSTPVPTATYPPRTPTTDPNVTPTREVTPSATPREDGAIVLRAQILDRTWTEVYLDNQDAVIYRILEPGESFEWIAEETLYIRVGNGAGISLNLNGEELGVMGVPDSLVVREWQRNPDGGAPILIDSQGG